MSETTNTHINTSAPVTVTAHELSGEVHGDVILTPRTWVRDALDARPSEVSCLAWTVGFWLALGAATGVGLVASILSAVWRITGA